MNIYDVLNKMVQDEINKGLIFNMKLNAYCKYVDAVEHVTKDNYGDLIKATEEMCRWWPEYIATFLTSLCIPKGETTSIDELHSM